MSFLETWQDKYGSVDVTREAIRMSGEFGLGFYLKRINSSNLAWTHLGYYYIPVATFTFTGDPADVCIEFWLLSSVTII